MPEISQAPVSDNTTKQLTQIWQETLGSVLLAGDRHARLVPRPRSGELIADLESRQLDPRAYAGSHWLFLTTVGIRPGWSTRPHWGQATMLCAARRTLQTAVEQWDPIREE